MIKYGFSWILLFTVATSLPAANSISNFSFNTLAVPVYEKLEVAFDIDVAYSNPYDPDIAEVNALITTPSGVLIEYPCFWIVPVTFNAGGNPVQNPTNASWMLRYAPLEAGNYTFQIKVTDAGGTLISSTQNFTATSATDPRGFVRIDNLNDQFFRFDNATPYYPVGMNNDSDDLINYKNYLTRADLSEFNWMRYWLSNDFGQALEWSNASGIWSDYNGLGRYSQNAAAKLDTLLNLCKDEDVYLQIVFYNHQQVFDGPDNYAKFDGVPAWGDPGSPYWTGNGGMVADALNWHGSAAAKAWVKKHSRYVIARYGYSRNILGWELFNETDYCDTYRNGNTADVPAWHAEISHHLDSLDVNDHLIMTSLSDPFWEQLYEDLSVIPEIDQIQMHRYTNDLMNVLPADHNIFKEKDKSTLFGEFGFGSDNPNNDPEGDHMRRMYWYGMMNACPTFYWSSGYGLAAQRAHVYQNLGVFLSDIDIVQETGGVPVSFLILDQPMQTGEITGIPSLTGFNDVPSNTVFDVATDGTIENSENLPRYIHGTSKPLLKRTLTFNTDFASASTMKLYVAATAGWSAPNNISVAIDGTPFTVLPVSGAGVYSFTISPGTHVVTLENTGADWVDLTKYVWETQIGDLATIGYQGPKHAYGYIFDRTYGEYTSLASAEEYTDLTLSVSGLDDGEYQVVFMDPKTGGQTVLNGVMVSGNTLTATIPDFKKDMAFKLKSVSPLPVELLSFTGRAISGNTIRLDWITASEKNSDYFIIQRSLDGNTWENIYVTDAAGNSVIQTNYFHSDQGLHSGIYYYRLLQVDTDGSENVSSVISVNLNGNSFYAKVYPNPTSPGQEIILTAEQSVDQVEVYTIQGEVLFSLKQSDSGKIMTVNAPSAQGVYLLKIFSGNTVFVKKLVVE